MLVSLLRLSSLVKNFSSVLMATISLPGLSSGDVGALGEAGCGQRLGGGWWVDGYCSGCPH